MNDGIQKFTEYTQALFEHINREQFNFVSLGVGEGSKDSKIISNFFLSGTNQSNRSDFLYIPVDMSLEMLKLAITKTPLPFRNYIAIQRDIEAEDSMREIALIAKTLGQQKPILYSFLGNTIANVDNPEGLFSRIASAMKSDDLLMFETRIIDPIALHPEHFEQTKEYVRSEYLSPPFHSFVESALLQLTDLSMPPAERRRSYVVELFKENWQGEDILRIDCYFENKRDSDLDLTMLTGHSFRLQPGGRIRLYRSRKFTQESLRRLISTNNLALVGHECSHPFKHQNGVMVNGVMAMLLRQNP